MPKMRGERPTGRCGIVFPAALPAGRVSRHATAGQMSDERSGDGMILVLGALAMVCLFIYIIGGCGDPTFKNFSQGCNGIASYEEHDGVTTMECDRGTTDRKRRPK